MKISEARIELDHQGKPIILFEAIPETSLEVDALKAIGYHLENEKAKCRDDAMSLKVRTSPPDSGTDSYLVSTFWQQG